MSALATVPRETTEAGQRLEHLPLSSIDVGENVRVDPGDLTELVASIAEIGVQSPVRAVGPNAAGRYRLVWGQRRYLACSQLGLTHIPALVEASSESDTPGARRSIEQLAENLIRKDLNPIEEAVALREVLDSTKGLTQDALAKRLGMSAPWVANTLGLLRAPKKVQDLVRAGEITAAHAKAVSGLPDDVQVRLAKSAVEREQSAHSLEESAKWERSRVNDHKKAEKATTDAIARGLAALEKSGVAEDARLYVYAEHWQIQDEQVRKAIKAAGYTGVDSGWARGGDRWSGCDCKALELRIRDGEGSTVKAVCTNDNHWRKIEAERNAAANEKAKTEEADRKRLASLVRAAMPAELNPTVGRLILRALDGYYGKTWADYSKLADSKLVEAIAEKLTSESTLRGASYNGDNKRIPVKTLIRELGGVDEEPASPAKPVRKRGSFTPAQAAAAVAELDRDGLT